MSTKIDTWMPLYICDFMGSTYNMSVDEQGAYVRMLMYAWRNCGELPNDDRRLLLISGMTPGRWKKSKAVLLAFFYISDNGAWRQNRLDAELERAQAQVNQRSEAGKASAAKRKAEREDKPQLPAAQDEAEAVEKMETRQAAPAADAALAPDAVSTAPAPAKPDAQNDAPKSLTQQVRTVATNEATNVATNEATTVATAAATNLQRNDQRDRQRDGQRNGIQSPSPLQDTSKTDSSSSQSSQPDSACAYGDDDVAHQWGEWRTFFANEYGIEINANSVHERKKFVPLATAWITAGVTFGQMRDAIDKARADAKTPIAYLPAYVDRVLASMSAPSGRGKAAESRWEMDDYDFESDLEAMEACIVHHGIKLSDPREKLIQQEADQKKLMEEEGFDLEGWLKENAAFEEREKRKRQQREAERPRT